MTLAQVLNYSKNDPNVRVFLPEWGNKMHGEPHFMIYYLASGNRDMWLRDGDVYIPTPAEAASNQWGLYDFFHNRHTTDGIIVAWHGEIQSVYNTSALLDTTAVEDDLPVVLNTFTEFQVLRKPKNMSVDTLNGDALQPGEEYTGPIYVLSRVGTQAPGITWTTQQSAADNNWISVTYGNGLFVAVAVTGTGNRVMTSPDGIAWTTRQSPANDDWMSVTYGNGLFVAVASSGTGGRVMTSPDGITWTARQSATAYGSWQSVTYGNGLFVAVSSFGSGGNVMTSPDGIAWTARQSASDNYWYGVTYGNGQFVAVALSGTGDRVMTST